MTITLYQSVFCNNSENIDNIIVIKKQYDSNVIPHVGEFIYNFMWKDVVESKVVEVCYDFDNNTCDVSLAKRLTSLKISDIEVLAKTPRMEKLG